jgi:GT2 family glycosyltransferase
MMYIGKRPTAFQQEETNIEINIFDFNQNIYNRNIRISILKYLREDIRFESLEALKEQLKMDEMNAHHAIDDINNRWQKKPKVTIAVLNYNGAELLESYLPMMEYSSSKYEFDVLLIDNQSTDASVDFVKEWYPEIKINELTQNYGYAEGYNVGLRDVETEYTVIINSDVLVTENWLDPLLARLDSDKTIGVVQPLIRSIEDKNKFEYAGAAGGFLDIWSYPFCRGRIFDTIEEDEGQYSESREIFWASGAAMVIRTQLFKNIGGFDKSFFAHQEEIDLCWRIKNAGYSVWNIPESIVYHLGGGTLQYVNPQKDYLNFRNNLMTITKNEKLAHLLWILPLKLILDGIAGVKFLLEGKPLSTWAVIRAHLRFYIMLPNIFERLNKEYTLIRRHRIGPPNKNGRYYQSIIFKYYIEGKKKFSDLNI